MSNVKPTIDSSWENRLAAEFDRPYFQQIKSFLQEELRSKRTIYPPGHLIFNAFNLTPFEEVKVVIIGQDPYHGPGQAHGLSFSVPEGIPPPPSLKNIFKELQQDLDLAIPSHGNLEKWARQGVLLLNAILTVRATEPASHSKIGWDRFTDAAIRQLSDQRVGIVFLLWGRFAQNKRALIDDEKHYVLTAAHPSPFSADKGFFGCKHFSRTNEILRHEGYNPIDWQL